MPKTYDQPNDKYSRLQQPLAVGSSVIKNRTVMGSMHTGLEHVSLERLATFYIERAVNDVGMIITGATAVNSSGIITTADYKLDTDEEAAEHRRLTDRVHQAAPDVTLCLQLVHAGSLTPVEGCVAPSAIKSPVGRFAPRALEEEEVEYQINSFVHSAVLAKQAGYDGVEIIGSGGYLISAFLLEYTNQRTDQWGGSYENRMRFATEIIRRVRQAVGPDFLVIYRIGLLELHDKGSSRDEVYALAKAIEAAGVSIISTHFTWHESRVPTIATNVPRAIFSGVTGELKKQVSVPVIVSNRINTAEVAEQLLLSDSADLVSMARPMLADPEIISKAFSGREDETNTCIACNQACLDHYFTGRSVTCLVNPRACNETELPINATTQPKKIAVVGAGPAGMAFSVMAATRGHEVTLYEQSSEIGGQFNYAKTVPGKEEFAETLRYFGRQLPLVGVNLQLNQKVDATTLLDNGFDEVVIATGVVARTPEVEGIDHPKVVSYTDVFDGRSTVGKRVAIMGAGGIGFDVAMLLSQVGESSALSLAVFEKEWGLDLSGHPRGGVAGVEPVVEPSEREIFLLQRKSSHFGKGLGKTTGWGHVISLQKRGVKMLGSVQYQRVDDQGLHLLVDGKEQLLTVDTVITCTGQVPLRELHKQLNGRLPTHLVGGADEALGLDAERAIDQATRLALVI